MIELPGLWSLTPIGGFLGVVALLYWLLATGRLIPRRTHERELATERQRGDEWKETSGEWKSLSSTLAAQNTDLLEGTRTTTALVRASAPGLSIDETTQPSGGA